VQVRPLSRPPKIIFGFRFSGTLFVSCSLKASSFLKSPPNGSRFLFPFDTSGGWQFTRIVKALRRLRRSARAAEIQDVPVPIPGPDDVLLAVSHCGVCGSDLHAFLNHRGYEGFPEQFTFGHEFSGVIQSIGSRVGNWRVGDRAVVVSVQGCLEQSCPYCSIGFSQLCRSRKIIGIHLDGGMAEYSVVGQKYLIRLPEGMDMMAAALAEPLSVADHCVSDCARAQKGELVVVSGPGIIGILCALIARLSGAEVAVVGTKIDNDLRLPVASKIGFETFVVGPEEPPLAEQLKKRLGRLADQHIEASGAPPALISATDAVRPLGSITVVGLYADDVPLNLTKLVRNQINIKTSYVSDIPNYQRAIQMLHRGDIPIAELVRTYSLKEGLTAFADAEKQAVLKPILVCQENNCQ
jgi:L-iditol 2-dehydrogenase